MKARIVFIISIIALLLSLFVNQCIAKDSEKHALLIAVGAYPKESGWESLSSMKDIDLIKEMLFKQGFKEENITIVAEQNAIKSNIVKAFKTLTAKVNAGDMVMIHFSGHGQQISDDNGDEIDHLDEALVPFDVDNTGKKHLRDDEIGEFINVLRAKLGSEGHVVVCLDACHSGTATRGDKKVRGGKKALILETKDAEISNNEKSETGSGLVEKSTKSRGAADNLAHFVLFSAAKSNETNFECYDDDFNSVGSLSYAMSMAFAAANENTTYRALFSKILSIMAQKVPYQTPVIEGDLDYKIFNGDVVVQEPYYNVIEYINDTILKIDGGIATGLSKGDVIGLFENGTSEIKNKTPSSVAVVREAGYFNSNIAFEKPHDLLILKEKWAFLVEKNYSESKYRLKVQLNLKSPGLSNKLTPLLDSLGLIQLTKDTPDLIVNEVQEKMGKAVSITTSGENKMITKSAILITNPQDIIDCAETIKNYAQSRFLKMLNLEDDNYRVEIELIPVKINIVNGVKIVTDTLYQDDNGTLDLHVGDHAIVRVKNTGRKDAYFSVIDIQPDGIINAILPDNDVFKSSEELLLKKGAKWDIPYFLLSIAEPIGTETFKIFATEKPLNLRPVITSKGVVNRTRGDRHPLEMILKKSYQNTRGASTGSMSMSSGGSISNYIFKISAK